MPSRVRIRIRSASNSATIANTLNSSRPIGSVGSCTEPPKLRLTLRRVSSSRMSRASGNDRARRSSLVTTNVSPLWQAANASRRPGRSRLVPAVVNVDAVIIDAESGEAVALRGQILLFSGHPRVAHQELVHRPALADTFGPVKP